jgi:hypothetical protein
MNTLRKTYFAKLEELSDSILGSYSKMNLHEMIKNEILPKMFEFDEYFIDEVRVITTKNLTDAGWKAFFEEFIHIYFDKLTTN